MIWISMVAALVWKLKMGEIGFVSCEKILALSGKMVTCELWEHTLDAKHNCLSVCLFLHPYIY